MKLNEIYFHSVADRPQSGELTCGKVLEASKDSDITKDSELSMGILLLRMSLDVESERVGTIELSRELDDEEAIGKMWWLRMECSMMLC